MNILEKMDLSEDIGIYYELSSEEQNEYHKEILEFANNNKLNLINYLSDIHPNKFLNINIIYIALAEAPEKWGDFLFEEFKRVFKIAKSQKKPFEYIECLDFPFNFENRNFQFIDNIIRYLETELNDPNDAVRYQSLYLLDVWIEDEEFVKYRSIIEHMAKKQNDKNWKIRNLTYIIFTGRPLLPNLEFKQSFFDKIRVNGYLFDSNPYKI